MAVLTVQNRKFEKEQRFIKTQQYYQNCYEQVTKELSEALDLISSLTKKAALVYIPNEMMDGAKYLPLFCFDKILRRQGKTSKEQRHVIDIYCSNFQYGFTSDEFIRSSMNGTLPDRFQSLMDLSEEHAGEFWVNLFRAYYKAGTQEEFQAFVDSVTAAIMQIAVLSDLDETSVVRICEEYIRASNIQIKQVMDIPVSGPDWMGVISIKDHMDRLRELYDYLIGHSGITESINEESLKELLDIMLLHSICDIAMLTKKPASTKLEMINDAVKMVGIVPIVSPEEYVKGVATGTGVGGSYLQYFSCNGTCGIFWGLIATMGGKVSDRSAGREFLSEHFSILVQIEESFVQKYQFLGAEQISRSYCLNIMNMMSAYIDSLEGK